MYLRITIEDVRTYTEVPQSHTKGAQTPGDHTYHFKIEGTNEVVLASVSVWREERSPDEYIIEVSHPTQKGVRARAYTSIYADEREFFLAVGEAYGKMIERSRQIYT